MREKRTDSLRSKDLPQVFQRSGIFLGLLQMYLILDSITIVARHYIPPSVTHFSKTMSLIKFGVLSGLYIHDANR